MDNLSLVQRIIVWSIPVIFAITGHEVAHGWVAKKYGDKTAWMLGRLTLNPMKHIDPIGTLLIPGILLLTGTGFIFGWAKPVPVDARHFKNPRHDMAIVALAGPMANMLMAVAWVLVVRFGIVLDVEFFSKPLIASGIAGISINLVLALINLLPVPPLDGSRIVSGILPPRWAWQYNKLEQYGMIILLILLFSGALRAILEDPMFIAQKLFFDLAGL
ncbi:MAG: site-2 protease family protein [Gammaproteobacteria bacterium]